MVEAIETIATSKKTLLKSLKEVNFAPPQEDIAANIMTFLEMMSEKIDNTQNSARDNIVKDHQAGKSYSDIWFDAIRDSKKDIIQEISKNANKYDHFDVNVTDMSGRTGLHYAALHIDGNDMVDILINDGHIDKAIIDHGNFSAYDLAKKFNHNTEIADQIRKELTGELKQSVKDGNEDRSKALIRGGADPKGESATPDVSMLSFAAGNTNSDTVKALIDAIPESERADFINKTGAGGRTGMHSAADAGDEVAYNYLKDAGGDESIKAEGGKTAKELLEAGVANKTKRDSQALDDLRRQNNVDSEDALNILKKQSKDGKGTIQQEAILNLYNNYKKGVDDKKFASDSVQAKFVRAMQAQSAIQSGYQILPYSEDPRPGGNHTYQNFEKPTDLTPQDLQAMIDPDKVQKQLSTLFQDKTVLGDYNNNIKSLAKDVGIDANQAEDRLYDQITGPGYTQFLQQAQDKGLSDQAKNQVRSDLASLSALDPDRGTQAAQILKQNSLAADIQKFMSDPSRIKDNSKLGEGVLDLFDVIRGGLRGSVNIPRTMIAALDGVIGLTDTANGKINKENAQVLGEIFQNVANNRGTDVNQDALREAIDKSKLSTELKPDLLKNLQTLNTKGFLGTIVGATDLVGAVGAAVKSGQGGPALKPAAETQMVLSFLSFSPAYARIMDTFIKSPNSKSVVDLLGLSKSLPEIWGKDGSVGSKLPTPDQVPLPEGDSPGGSRPVTPPRDQPGAIELNDFYDRLGQLSASEVPNLDLTNPATSALPPDPATLPKDITPASAKVFASIAKVLGAVGDFGGGIAGIVTAALDLKSADNAGQRAADGLNIASGALVTTAGAIELASLAGITFAAAGAVTGVLFAGAAILGVIAFGIAEAIQHNKQSNAAKGQDNFFRNLDSDGLLKDGWQDKLEYARYETYEYKGRDAPKDQSIFEYQAVEFDHFKDTPGKHGSSNSRMDPNRHQHYDAKSKHHLDGEPRATARNGNPPDIEYLLQNTPRGK